MMLLLFVLVGLVSTSLADWKVRNSQCVFPFRYEGHTYHYCTNFQSKVPWCSMDSEFKKGSSRYVYCLPSVCKFPFIYKGKRYESCTNAESSSYWCSSDTVYGPGSNYYGCPNFEGPFDVNIYCVSSQNKTYNAGERWKQDCTEFTCLDEGRYSFSSACKGRYGCHPVGSKDFPCTIRGQNYDKCSCTGDDQNPFTNYQSPVQKETYVEETEVRQRFCMINGEIFNGRKRANCTDFECVNGNSVIRKKACQDSEYNCFDLDTSGFRCYIDDKVKARYYDNCKCEDADGYPQLSGRSKAYVKP